MLWATHLTIFYYPCAWEEIAVNAMLKRMQTEDFALEPRTRWGVPRNAKS